MSVHIEATVDPAGRIVLEHLPFVPGEKVDIVIERFTAAMSSEDLHGSVLKYDNPFDPVAAEDWPFEP